MEEILHELRLVAYPHYSLRFDRSQVVIVRRISAIQRDTRSDRLRSASYPCVRREECDLDDLRPSQFGG